MTLDWASLPPVARLLAIGIATATGLSTWGITDWYRRRNDFADRRLPCRSR